MSHSREVVVTGTGVISPIGIGNQEYWASLQAGRSGISTVDCFRDTKMPVQMGGQLLDFNPKQYITPRKSIKVMSRAVQISVAAASLAMRDASLERGAVDPERLGVVYGNEFLFSSHSELTEFSDVMHASMHEGRYENERYGPAITQNIEPLWLLKYLPNMGACHVAISFDARSAINTIVLGEVSGMLAIMEGARVIERGSADVMIAGGGGDRLSLVPMLFRGDKLLSHRNDDPASASRPFDAGRDGMVNGEGAGAIVLEERRHAEARGAPILARFVGGASVFGQSEGPARISQDAVERSISQALAAAHAESNEIGFVIANGLSTQHEDIAEAAAIASRLKDKPVTALKSYFGNLGSGASIVESIGGILAMQQGEIPATLNYQRPDPDCPIPVIHGETEKTTSDKMLQLSQSRTGQAAALLLARA